jgi:hypothetical protein
MPYITPEHQKDVDMGTPPANVGELTYKLQQALREYLEEHGLRYQQLAECLGALEGCKLDLIERVVKPYEAKKRSENGDVWGTLAE